MKAVVLSRYGSPDVLTVADIAKPEPRTGEVLVKVFATAVNDWDWSLVRGKPYVYRLMYGLFRPKLSVPGVEVAGVVEAIGSGASAFKPGDRVYGDISEAGLGGFAEYVRVREDALVRMPEAMTFEQAAALPHAAILALQGLVDLGNIQRGERVLINGAGGGVGMIGVQIAKDYSCEVTGVDRNFKLAALKAWGFDHVIDYQQADFTRSQQQYDLILDARTTRSPFAFLRVLKPGGRYVTVGGSLLRLFQLVCFAPIIAALTGKRLRVVALKPNKGLDHINRMFESGTLQVVIDGPYPLEEVPQALQRFGDARHSGKIVIAVVPRSCNACN
jgi:NADPH:quinone reductase-like Zn-dependent oxidoreductase